MNEAEYAPLSAEELQQLAEIDHSRVSLGLSLLSLESQKIALLAQAKRVDTSWREIMAKIATDRDIPPETPFSIDPESGRLTFDVGAAD